MTAVGMDALPRDEQWAVWDETGRNFWQKFDNDNHIHDAKSEAHYQMQVSSIKGELYELTNKRTQLTHSQERLSKELAQVEEELARVVQACDDKVTVLHTLEQDCRRCEREKLERRSQIATTMDKFFREKQGKDPSAPARRDRQHFHDIVNNIPQRMIPNREAVHAEALQQANEVARSTQALPSKKAQTSVSKSKPGNVLVNITNSDGHVIGPVEKIEPWNQWVEAIQDVPIRRQVKIRRGRKFTQDHLATIYDRSEAKGVKWVACMIQATGQIQQQRCSSCDKNQGAFDDCIILGGPLFQKCGNCEWNRQGCHMPTKTDTSSSMHCPGDSTITERSEMLVFRPPPPPPPPLPPPPPPPPPPTGQGQNRSMIRSYASHEPKGGSEPVRLPTPNEYGFLSHRQQHDQQQKYPASSVLTPANARSRPLSRDIPTPSIQSVENSPQPMPQAEITRSNLALRHDGTAYIYPECVEGVPLIKIDQRHPYWDPRWPSIQSIIKPQLDMWKIKYNEAIQRKAKGEGGSAKFQTGRQVNRGVKILEFLEQGDISPYQLLSKKYTHTGKGTITAYDTLFRMCETLGELAKFRLDISPVEWLRHRLHEIILEEGANFNYSKTMHDFYHDPKLAALRDRNGFKSIGRPSGFKAGQGGGRGTSGTPTSVKKRKSMHSQTDTPRATPSASHSPLIPSQEEYIPSPVPSSSITHTADPAHTIPKRLKPLSPVSAPPSDEFYTDDVSDTDSWSGAPLQKLDWRVYQVKTRLFTSQTEVTQYWHWKEDKRVFEHQVLKDTKPVTWGLLRAPIDFDIPLDDIAQVDWNMDALQVHFVMSQFGSSRCIQDGKPRGDVMATFKRATTMRRFLSYCRQRRLKLTSITADEIEKRWAAMPSYKLPVIDDEASPALRE